MQSNRPKNQAPRVDSSDPIASAHRVVGVGFSAGGLEAFKEFVRGINPDTWTSYIVVQHLPPHYRSHLLEIIESSTPLTVRHPEHRHPIKSASIYVLDEDAGIRVENGRFMISPLPQKTGRRSSIDVLFDSLAQDKAVDAVGVVLSGSGSDGTVGLQKIKAQGGMCLAQNPDDAGFPGMPKSAIETGCVDFVGPADELARKTDGYFNYRDSTGTESGEIDSAEEKMLLRILELVRRRSGNDFSDYRRSSVLRRVERRMGLAGVPSLSDYYEMLRRNRSEVQALSENILISVTCFFRDSEVWETLSGKVIPKLIENKQDGDDVRVWIPGCATGEEAYSLAILLNEAMEQAGKQLGLRIFGTDIDERARKIARAGIYPAGIVVNVGERYLEKYFESTHDDRYAIAPWLREKVTFARQNIFSDPPFSRMDMVSCRNLLIYLETSMQEQVIRLLHFALRKGGVVVLGSSETIGNAGQYFNTIHREHRIFKRIGSNPMRADNGGVAIPTARPPLGIGSTVPGSSASRTMEETSRALVMDHFSAVSAIVDPHMSIRYIGGKTERYLHQPEGPPTNDLSRMVDALIGLKLRQLGNRALEEDTVKSFEATLDGATGGRIRVTIKPMRLDRLETGLFVLFEEVAELPASHGNSGGGEPIPEADDNHRSMLNGLDRDLKEARNELARTVSALEASNEDLRVSNEEVMSMNEELQSSNEELETSKEELQRLNEELNTANRQLSAKVTELERSHNDIHNLLTSTNTATIFLDEEMRVQRFTPACRRIFKLIRSDVGRPISELEGKLDDDNLVSTCRLVLEDLKSREKTVAGLDQTLFLRRILPYRDQDNRIGGVVITFDDITELGRTQRELAQAEQYLRLAIQNSPVIIFAQDLDLKYTYVLNQPSEYRPEDIIGKTDKEILPGPHEQLDALKQAVLRTGRPAHHKIQITTKNQNTLWLDITMECLRDPEGKIAGLCGASIQITDQVAREAKLEQAKEGAEANARAKSKFLSSMSHDIRTPLTAMIGLSKILSELPDKSHRGIAKEIQHDCNYLLKTLNSVLYFARLETGKVELPLEPVDLAETLGEIRSVFDPSRKRTEGRNRIRLTVDDPPIQVQAEKGALLRVLGNLISNALKFCPDDPAEIRVSRKSDMVRIEVADKGPGISPEFQKDIFKPFSREGDEQKSSPPGSGLGLSITRELVGLMQGSIEVQSEVGRGTTMIVCLPLSQNERTPVLADNEHPPVSGALGNALIRGDDDST